MASLNASMTSMPNQRGGGSVGGGFSEAVLAAVAAVVGNSIVT
jgi:hypothetical protein